MSSSTSLVNLQLCLPLVSMARHQWQPFSSHEGVSTTLHGTQIRSSSHLMMAYASWSSRVSPKFQSMHIFNQLDKFCTRSFKQLFSCYSIVVRLLFYCCLIVVQLLFNCCSIVVRFLFNWPPMSFVVQFLFNCFSIDVQLLFKCCSIVIQLTCCVIFCSIDLLLFNPLGSSISSYHHISNFHHYEHYDQWVSMANHVSKNFPS